MSSDHISTRNVVQLNKMANEFNSIQFNRPFPRCRKPLFQNEAKCKTFLVKMTFFIIMQIKLILTRKVCTWPRYKNEGFFNSEMAYSNCLWTLQELQKIERYNQILLTVLKYFIKYMYMYITLFC